MAKHFQTKRHLRKKWLLEYLFFIALAYLILKLCIYSLVNIPVDSLLQIETIGQQFYGQLKDKTINNPIFLLNYHGEPKQNGNELPVMNEETNIKKVYLYSTHDTEKYATKQTILDASKYLEQALSKQNIQVVRETGSIAEFMKANNYDYTASYKASRYFIEEEMSKNTYDLIIDVHRDAISKKNSTLTMNGKSYAKILWVIGKEHENYQKNYQVAYALHQKLQKKYPDLSRGVLLQSGPNVNGIYNQDLNDHIILLELGGNQNTYEEVQNTIDLLAPLIGEYLYEQTI